MTDHQEVIELLYGNIHALPHETFGHLDMVPFAVESDQTNAMKRAVSEGIVNLLSDAGFLARRDAPAKPLHNVTLSCRMCSSPLIEHMMVDDGGVANLPAASFIAAVARLDPECPHRVLTADDHRRRIEEAVMMGGQ